MTAKPSKPWYWEDPRGAWINAWTPVHVASGTLFALLRPKRYGEGMILHTAYEVAEGSIFPVEARDTSAKNHVGDSAAFLAGMLIANALGEKSK